MVGVVDGKKNKKELKGSKMGQSDPVCQNSQNGLSRLYARRIRVSLNGDSGYYSDAYFNQRTQRSRTAVIRPKLDMTRGIPNNYWRTVDIMICRPQSCPR
jgi:hypothetical protein